MSRSKRPKQQESLALPAPTDGSGDAAETSGCLPALVRLLWLLFGNLGLVLLAVLVANGTAPVAADAALFALAAALVGVRYLDITRFKGHTSEGAPATLAHWRSYAVKLGVASAGLWALARLVAWRGWL